MITVKQEYLAEVNLLNGQFCVDIAKIKPAKSMRVIGRMEFFRSNRPVFSRQTPFVGKFSATIRIQPLTNHRRWSSPQ